MSFSTVDHLRRVYEQNEPLLAFRAENASTFHSWKAQVKRKLWDLLGELPTERCPLKPTVTDERREDGYVRQRVIFYVDEVVRF